MVRAPCCEKMGLKRGPWTPEEDRVLVAYIQKFGHGNWRALPKQAGLLRCGKSCRLRWTNYLRPDIKRGNFTREEEDTIIELHQMLGNRWSAIAARLPGRTDNEIKNVWHTHLKKRLKKNQTNPSDNKPRRRTILPKHEPSTEMQEPSTEMQESKPELKTESNATNPSTSEITENAANVPVSPEQSSSEVSNATDSSFHATSEEENDTNVKKEYDDSWDKLPNVGDDLWSEFTPMENFTTLEDDFPVAKVESQVQVPMPSIATNYSSNLDESMDFWYDVFIKAGDFPELPEF